VKGPSRSKRRRNQGAFEGWDITALAKKYGVNLVDFNDQRIGRHSIFHENLKLHVAKEAWIRLLINILVPRLTADKDILGLKNLKGCLKVSLKSSAITGARAGILLLLHRADFVKPGSTSSTASTRWKRARSTTATPIART